ncbi:hypothetical protein JCM5296_000273 [Sporobolomyces johnsonii]
MCRPRLQPFPLAPAQLLASLLLVLPAIALPSAPPPSVHIGAEGSSPLKKRSSTKAVFAHVVQVRPSPASWVVSSRSLADGPLNEQGDFQNYSEGDYQADAELAKAAGIDAFAMNVGHDSSDSAQLAKAFSAAATVSDFYLFFSFDMNYFSTSGSSDSILNEYLVPFADSSAYYLYEGQVFVSTFSGEVAGTFLDGAASFADSNTAWSTLLDNAKSALGKDIYFVPNWNDVSLVPQNTWGGGIMSWAAWGAEGRTTAMTTDSDVAYRAAATKAGLSYMAPVAAFFFVHVAASNNYVLQS